MSEFFYKVKVAEYSEFHIRILKITENICQIISFKTINTTTIEYLDLIR